MPWKPKLPDVMKNPAFVATSEFKAAATEEVV
jgi:hypothetical protein